MRWWTDQQLPKVPMIQMRPGEPMFAAIEREVRKGGYMLAAQPDGSIKVARAGTTRHAGALVLGQAPVKRCHVHLSPRSKRSPVVTRGQRRSGTGAKNLRQEHRDGGDGDDRHRPALVVVEGDHDDDDLKRRARWHRLRTAGQGLTVEITVSAWRDAGGTIWDPKDLRYEHRGDARGWVGDGFDVREDLGERPLGSRLWLYRRSVLVTATRATTLMAIEADARLALQPLLRQGAAAEVDVAGTADGPSGIIALAIGIYARGRRELYAGRFDLLTRRADGL